MGMAPNGWGRPAGLQIRANIAHEQHFYCTGERRQ